MTVAYKYGGEETVLTYVEESSAVYLEDGIDVLTVELTTDGKFNRESLRVALMDQRFYKYEGDAVSFRGEVSEVRFSPEDRYKLTIKVRAFTSRLEDLEVNYSAKQSPVGKLGTIYSFAIRDDNMTQPGSYITLDHAYMIVPATDSSSYTNETIDSYTLVPSTPTSTDGTLADINDSDDETYMRYRLATTADFTVQLKGSSTNAKANVIGRKVEWIVHIHPPDIALIGVYTLTVKFQYKDENAVWQTIAEKVYGETAGIPLVCWSGFSDLDDNTFIDGSDDFEYRFILDHDPSLVGDYNNIRVNKLHTTIYTDAGYIGVNFPISSYWSSATDLRAYVSPNPLTAGVDVGDSGVIGEKDSISLQAIFDSYTASEIPFNVSIDANFDGYSANVFDSMSLLDVVTYYCKKERAHWYFRHTTNTLYIEKETTIEGNANSFFTESSIVNYSLQDKSDARVKSVIVYGATFQVAEGDEYQVRYQYPEDSQDTVETFGYRTHYEDNPEIYSDTEAGIVAKGIFESFNNSDPNMIITPNAHHSSQRVGRTITSTFEGVTYTTIPVTGITVMHDVGNDLQTDSYTLGFQKTALEKRLSKEISELKKAKRELKLFGRKVINAPTGSYIDSDDRYVLDHAVLDVGNESISGVKTFTSSPIVPTPTTDYQASTKKHVDDGLALKANDDVVVKLTGNQSIDGTKTFLDVPIAPAPYNDNHLTNREYVDEAADVLLHGFNPNDLDNFTLSFDKNSRQVTLTHISDYTVYINGVAKVITTTTDLDDPFPDTEGLHFVYFQESGDGLLSTTTPFYPNDRTKALVSMVYWNATANDFVYKSFGCHTTSAPPELHDMLHFTHGAQYCCGLEVTDATLGQINITEGTVYDDDLKDEITDGAGSGRFEQRLTLAYLPVIYREGTTDWRKITATVRPFYDNGAADEVHYNKLVGSTWSTEATSSVNNYVAYFIYAWNDVNEPIMSVMGQDSGQTTLRGARENNRPSELTFGTVPTDETVLLYRILVRNNLIEEYTDYRTNEGVYSIDELESYVDTNTVVTDALVERTFRDHISITVITDQTNPQVSLVSDCGEGFNLFKLDKDVYSIDDETITLVGGTLTVPTENWITTTVVDGVPQFNAVQAQPDVDTELKVCKVLVGGTANNWKFYTLEDRTAYGYELERRIFQRSVAEGGLWVSGFALTIDGSNYVQTDAGTANCTMTALNGSARDTSVSDVIYYYDAATLIQSFDNLNDITLYGDGGSIGTAKYFNVILFYVLSDNNQSVGQIWSIVQDEPATEYVSLASAIDDSESKTVYTLNATVMRNSIHTARLICQKGSTTVTVIRNIDLRGEQIGAGGGGATPSDHGSLSGLGDDDHSQYFKVTGRTAENLTVNGNIIVTGVVDGVDIATLKSDYDTHAANTSNPHSVDISDVNVVDASKPALILDSIGTGDNWTAQGAHIAIGETASVETGTAALRMTYLGSGLGYIGMGGLTNGIPAYYIRFAYNNNNLVSNMDFDIASLELGGSGIVADYITNTISGDHSTYLVTHNGIQTFVNNSIDTHHLSTSTDHDNRYYTETEIDALVVANPLTADLNCASYDITELETIKFDYSATGALIQLKKADTTLTTALYRHTNNGGLSFGADDALVMGCGESRTQIYTNVNMATEYTYIGSDNAVYILTTLQNGWASRKTFTFNTNGFKLITGSTVNEFSSDGTLAGNSDAAIPTEQAVKTHFANYYTKAEINVIENIGSANSFFQPCTIISYDLDSVADMKMNILGVSNAVAGSAYAYFQIPLATNMKGKKLHIASIRMSLTDADASNFVTTMQVAGITSTGTYAYIATDNDDKKVAGAITYEFGDLDVSAYRVVRGYIRMTVVAAGLCDVNSIEAQVYWDD